MFIPQVCSGAGKARSQFVMSLRVCVCAFIFLATQEDWLAVCGYEWHLWNISQVRHLFHEIPSQKHSSCRHRGLNLLEKGTLTGYETVSVQGILRSLPASWPCPWPRKSRQEESVSENQSSRISQFLKAEYLHCNE